MSAAQGIPARSGGTRRICRLVGDPAHTHHGVQQVFRYYYYLHLHFYRRHIMVACGFHVNTTL